jgi:FkbM family methyltransferase
VVAASCSGRRPAHPTLQWRRQLDVRTTPDHLSRLIDTSQHGEAGAITPLIGAGWTPFVVDVGASDGRTLSNSFPFLSLGWSGILIEPLPAAFERLSALYADRGDVACVQAACGARDGVAELQVGADPLGMTSTLTTRTSSETVTVPVRSLTSVLASAGAPSEPAALFVDAEGMDYEVLSGLDFDRFRPRIVITEDDMRDPDKHAAKARLLEDRGYVLYATVGNSIWAGEDVVREALGVRGPVAAPVTDREGALRRVAIDIVVRRCLELEARRDELWHELTVLRESRSWRMTRPLRALVARLR